MDGTWEISHRVPPECKCEKLPLFPLVRLVLLSTEPAVRIRSLIFLVFVFLFCMRLQFPVFCVFVLFCVLFLLFYTAVSFLFFTSLPTNATGWKPNCSKQIPHKFNSHFGEFNNCWQMAGDILFRRLTTHQINLNGKFMSFQERSSVWTS